METDVAVRGADVFAFGGGPGVAGRDVGGGGVEARDGFPVEIDEDFGAAERDDHGAPAVGGGRRKLVGGGVGIDGAGAVKGVAAVHDLNFEAVVDGIPAAVFGFGRGGHFLDFRFGKGVVGAAGYADEVGATDLVEDAAVHADVDAGVVVGFGGAIDDADLAIAEGFLRVDEEAETTGVGFGAEGAVFDDHFAEADVLPGGGDAVVFDERERAPVGRRGGKRCGRSEREGNEEVAEHGGRGCGIRMRFR